MSNQTSNISSALYQALWNSADILRSKMDANEYKSYLLGIIFYKYLSDKLLNYVAKIDGKHTDDLTVAQEIYVRYYDDEDARDDLYKVLITEVGYIIEPALTFTHLVNQVNINEFQLESLAQGFRNIEQSHERFENLFEDIDLYSKKLGSTPKKQNQTISEIMKELAQLNIVNHQGDVLGDAYEYLIRQFASDSGKNAGEFYTPQSVAKLMTQIVLYGRENQKGFTVYDATMGSGSLLLNAKKYSNQPGTIVYYGQELNTSTYNLARMNMVLHGVPIENQKLHNADTLDQDWPTEEPTNFDAVLMNPPYSAKWSANAGFLQDSRFSSFGVLAPKSKADFAFLLHGYYHLKQTNGVMAIVLPHGVLFRGNAEGKIRKKLLEDGAIDTVIGLPANIFYNTSIPTTVIILKKDRTNRDVLFIDASKDFVKNKKQNDMNDEHINKILQAYINRQDIEKYAHVASFEEIKENDYNLNIPRYVDTFEEEEPIDIVALSKEIVSLNQEIKETEAQFLAMLDELAVTDDTKDLIQATREVFKW
ncbi:MULTISPECIES: type I restriction-modification system subunit M [unclassified Granulicatella]|uniref:type I restriction-modification system subunit M n=1 Tax=unclassified Granulicatella TaxID=2630493 RepID=UPI0010736672|nr:MULTISPECIES: type I restriction-modification system subunit M [unclassified Granulicatella]MBF0780369.1 type I restriction-modification system subunit M [Granulicatella sp. 19428wC4_WM01]TFU95502.1 type I restriction-modification system subunit M [Granulicatella sp. WM01]